MFSYRRKFQHQGRQALVIISSDFKRMTSVLSFDGIEVARDEIVFETDGARNLLMRVQGAEGADLTVEAGYCSLWDCAIAVRENGVLVHESHPGRTIAWPDMPFMPKGQDAAERSALMKAEAERFRRIKPSLFVDVGLALLFFAVAKMTDLTTAAIVGVVAGIALLIIQRFVKSVDLLGGLAIFGIVVAAIGAVYAVVVQDEELIKLRSTILGGAVALVFLADGMVFRGRWLGKRIARFFPVGTLADRLAIGIGGVGLISALANWLVVRAVSTDAWLWYTTFGDTILTIGLIFGVMAWAKPKSVGEALAGSDAKST